MTRIANLLSPDLDALAAEIGSSLQASSSGPLALAGHAGVDDLRRGDVGMALLCGLAYALLHDSSPERFAAVAAPVVDDPRGEDAPVYFSEIVVPARSPARALDDLAGARFAYNETLSFSGYRALEHELGQRGEGWQWFGESLHTGSHAASLEKILAGEADAAAIDSHVLVLTRRRNPERAAGFKVVESLGPYPAPPLAMDRGACDLPAARVTALLSQLPVDCLHAAAIRRWQPVDDAYYDPIRAVTRDLPDLDI